MLTLLVEILLSQLYSISYATLPYDLCSYAHTRTISYHMLSVQPKEHLSRFSQGNRLQIHQSVLRERDSQCPDFNPCVHGHTAKFVSDFKVYKYPENEVTCDHSPSVQNQDKYEDCCVVCYVVTYYTSFRINLFKLFTNAKVHSGYNSIKCTVLFELFDANWLKI